MAKLFLRFFPNLVDSCYAWRMAGRMLPGGDLVCFSVRQLINGRRVSVFRAALVPCLTHGSWGQQSFSRRCCFHLYVAVVNWVGFFLRAFSPLLSVISYQTVPFISFGFVLNWLE